MNPQTLNHIRHSQVEKIEREKQSIVQCIKDFGGRASFKQISKETGIIPEYLTNRLTVMKRNEMVKFVGRTGTGNVTDSWYEVYSEPDPIEIITKLPDYPKAYLVWGGWTA